MSPWGGLSQALRHTRDTLVGPPSLGLLPEELEEVAGMRMVPNELSARVNQEIGSEF